MAALLLPIHRRTVSALLFALIFFSAAVANAETATIIRDNYGVPHIFADSPEAAAYALGIAQCEDNLPVVVRNLFAGVGRLSELLGRGFLDGDVRARELGHGHFAARDWPKLDPGLRSIVQAYCDGVNDYLKAHPDELPFNVPAVEPVQVIAWHRSVFLLSAVKISQADAEASKADGYQPADTSEQESQKAGFQHPGIQPGRSNSWALAGSKTQAGVPMLLIDPHWVIEGPLQLYEAYLHGDDLQCGGFMLNGTPLPGIGMTPATAWTVTAGGADSSDAYALRINPENPHQYEFDGEWEDMTVRRETIRVQEADRLREQVVEVLSTRHGPVLKTSSGVPYAAAFSGHDRADAMVQNYRMVMARNTTEFKAAMAMDRYTYFNLMWATAEGDIGYVQTGEVPLRPSGFNWTRMVPGWTSRALYQGRVPFDGLPAVENPPTGFLQNCNVAANVVTPGLTFTKDDFPIGALWGHYGQYRARGQRATQLLSQIENATLEDGRRIAFDAYVPPADLWIPVILQAYKEREGTGDADQLESDQAHEAGLAEAVDILRKWNRCATRDSHGATVFRFWRLECEKMKPSVGRDRFEIPNTPEVRRDALQALTRAAKRLKTTYGKLTVPWGEIKVLRRDGKEWPLSGDGLGLLGMDTLRATAAENLTDDHKLVLRGGQCVTSVVLLTNPPTIHSVVTYGQSNKPDSKHFADQAPLYSAERMREVAWTREQLAGRIETETHFEYTPRAPGNISIPDESAAAAKARHERVAQRRAGIQIICHRGALEFAHENTLEAYRAAFELAADGNEIDIRATKDGVLICFHDDMLDHLLEAYGDVADYTWDELRRFRIRNPGRFGPHCRIPTLVETFELHRQHAGLLHLDIKRPELAEPVMRLLDRMDMWDHVVQAPSTVDDPRVRRGRYKASLYSDRSEVDAEAIAAALEKPGDSLIVEDPRGVAVALGRKLGRPTLEPVASVPAPVPQAEPPLSIRELLDVLRDAEDWNQVASGAQAEAESAQRIVRRARAADALAGLDVAHDEAIGLLEQRVRHRSLHRHWRYHGLDGAAALRTLIRSKAPHVVELARLCLWRDDPNIEPVVNPQWDNPRSWTDWRTKIIVFPELARLPGAETERLCRDYLALSDEAAAHIGIPQFEAAARTLLTVSPNLATVCELMKHRRSDVRGRAVLFCLAHKPWATPALARGAPHALQYLLPEKTGPAQEELP